MATLSKDIFDQIEDTNQGDIFDQIEFKGKSKSIIPKVKSIARAGARGLLKTATELPQQVNPLLPRGPLTPKQQQSLFEELLGSPEEGFAEQLTERIGETAPLLLGGEGALGAKLGKAGLSSLLGQLTKEAGGGELAQTGAEIAGLGLPGLGKKIIPKKGQEKMIEFFRKKGLTEKEIAPLLSSKKAQGILKHFIKSSSKVEERIGKSREAVGNIYENLEQEAQKLPILSSNNADILKSDLQRKLEKLPTDLRKNISNEIEDVFKKPIKADDLIRLWRSVNSSIYSKGATQYRKKLNILKDDIFNSIEEISPELAKDFTTTNEAYAKAKSLFKNVKTGDKSLWNIGKVPLLVYSTINAFAHAGDPLKAITKVGIAYASEKALKKFAAEMLTNPRLQNLSKQMALAIKNHKIPIAKKIQEKINNELEKKEINLEKKSIAQNPSK